MKAKSDWRSTLVDASLPSLAPGPPALPLATPLPGSPLRALACDLGRSRFLDEALSLLVVKRLLSTFLSDGGDLPTLILLLLSSDLAAGVDELLTGIAIGEFALDRERAIP